jgi:hypothetical protein
MISEKELQKLNDDLNSIPCIFQTIGKLNNKLIKCKYGTKKFNKYSKIINNLNNEGVEKISSIRLYINSI